FEDTLFPVNDLVFTLLFALFIVALYRAWCEMKAMGPRPTGIRGWLPDIAVGATAGGLLLAKPSGAVLIGGGVAAAYVIARRAGHPPGMQAMGISVLTALLCYAPWAIRNLVTFGAPFHTT